MAEEVAEIFSKHIFSSKYEDLSEKTIKQLKVFLLDTIGVGIAGSTGSKLNELKKIAHTWSKGCLLYTSPSPRDGQISRMPSSA